MHPILRNILAVVAGLLVGGALNWGIVKMGSFIITPPEGYDDSNMERMKSTMHLLGNKNFIFPFLAHSLGTLVGALLAVKIAVSHYMKFALAIGLFFMLGGIMMVLVLSAPTWFVVLDLAGAYIPMAWIGGKLAGCGKMD